MQLSSSSINMIAKKLFGYAKNEDIEKAVDKKDRTTIQLNGQSYNAISGQRIGAKTAVNIDGFVRKSGQKNYSPTLTSITNQPLKVKPHHLVNNLEKKPNPSQTLMRKAVNKPLKTNRLINKVTSPIRELSKADTIKTPIMAGNVNPGIARRAKTFKLSNQISRFGAPIKSAKQLHTPPNNTAVQEVKPIVRVAKKDLFEQAIENANSHQQPPLTKKELKALHGKHPHRGRVVAYLAVGFMALAIIGYGVYQNIPNVMVKVASVRAGFAANLPSYRPSGFSLSSVGYQPGTIAFNFKGNIDNRKYTLTEHSSNWDSATLVSSIVVPIEGHDYKKIMVDGQAVYLYGQDQASWVSSGIWYQVQGDESLSTNQLIKLATTL